MQHKIDKTHKIDEIHCNNLTNIIFTLTFWNGFAFFFEEKNHQKLI